MQIKVNYRSIEFEAPNYLDLTLDGILGLPEIESHDLSFSTRSGLMPGFDFARGKNINFSGSIVATDETTYGQAVENLRYAFEPRDYETDLFVTVPGLAGGRQVSLGCRPRRGSLKIDTDYDNMSAAFSVDLFATNPYFYAASNNAEDLTVVQTTVTASTGGHGFDHGFNLGFGGGGSTALIVTNNGNAISYPTIIFFGPLINPHIVNQAAAGDGLSFDINLGSLDFLVVNTELRQIALNGNTNRYDTINDSDWFGIYPGNNTIIFTVDSTTGVPIAQLAYRDAWL